MNASYNGIWIAYSNSMSFEIAFVVDFNDPLERNDSYLMPSQKILTELWL